MKKPCWFYSDLYFENIYFCPAFTYTEFSESVFKITGSPVANLYATDFKVGGNTFQYFNKKEESAIFIWLPSKKMTANNLSALSHECVHAANLMFIDRGVKLDHDNDEPLAYLVSWIFKNCVRRMNK